MSLTSYKNIAVLGIGISGKAALRLLSTKKSGEQYLFAFDSRELDTWSNELPEGVICYHQDMLEANLSRGDLLVVSPGVDTRDSLFTQLKDAGVDIISEIELASWWIEAPIIGITGTNGKTTTVSFLGECFKAAGVKVFVGGNIGIPLCEALIQQEFELYLLELSSFQLERLLKLKIDYPMILNLSESHMERYANMEEYVLAKSNIFRQHSDNEEIFIRKEDFNNFKKIFRSIKGKFFYIDDQAAESAFLSNFDIQKIKLIGNHNLNNLKSAWVLFNKICADRTDAFKKTLYSFTGLEHRMEELQTSRKYRVINDTKSTNLDSTWAALCSFSESVHLCLGGKLRNDQLDINLLNKIMERCHSISLFGEAKNYLLTHTPREKLISINDFYELGSLSIQADVFLFSPGFPSFDQFKNYAHRGSQFKQLFS